MKIHYISCHSILEYDEVSLLTELKHDVFSNGAYIDPAGHFTLPRPAIKGAKYHTDLAELARTTPRTELPSGLIDYFDTFIIMHSPDVLFQNWNRIKHKNVLWRSIGQSTGGIENRLKPLVAEGLKIIRYSPREQKLPNYAGESAMIRFYKDSEEFKGWTGHDPVAINITQSLKGRRDFCHYDEITELLAGFPAKVYGTGNEDLAELNGGELPYEYLKGKLRDARVYIYGGTWPACYTLSLIEAMMTGIPVVAIGEKHANVEKFEQLDFYEVSDIIKNGINGFCSDNMNELREAIKSLLENQDYARQIGVRGRETAIKLFGKQTIKEQWEDYLLKL